MGTKIYNAYKYSGTYEYLIKDLNEIREGIYDWVLKDFKNKSKDNSLLMHYLWEKSQSVISAVAKADADVAIIYTHGINLYVQFFGGLWDKLDNVYYENFEEYEYQNQSDPPYVDEADPAKRLIMEKDWEKRKKIWNSIFDTNVTPKMAGTSYYLMENNSYLKMVLNIKKEIKDG